MRFFSLLDFQYVMLLIFLGLLLLLAVYISFGGHVLPARRTREEETEEYPQGIRTQRNPMPLVLFFIYAGFAVWAVTYVVAIGIKGPPF